MKVRNNMQITLNNELVQAVIDTAGAQLISLKSSNSNTEYIWQRDPKYWKFCSPILFPNVGKLKDDFYYYEGKKYSLPSHGFGRHSEFELIKNDTTSAVFRLTDSEESLQVYPFHFYLDITYQLTGAAITVSYSVKNTGANKMFFSIGAHPAFNIPFEPDSSFSDYQLEIAPAVERERFLLAEDALVDSSSKETWIPKTIDLSREFFKNDAFVIASQPKDCVSLCSTKTGNKIQLSYENFPYLGIWSKYPEDAPFVCIEPWCGIASDTASDGNIETKTGINALQPEEIFERSYTIEIIEA